MSLPNIDDKRIISLSRMKVINESGDHSLRVYLAALEYIKMGIYILPIEKNAKSLPYHKQHGITYGCASKNKSTIEKWFDPYKGKFAGWNIGIATGKENGVFAIDVDIHGEDNGFDYLHVIEKKEGKLIAPSQITPGGGKHFLFKWQENASCTTNKIAKSIDTRGGNETSCKGHIVAFPSIIDGKMYKWETGGEILEIPKWVMEKLGVTWRPASSSTNRGNENIGEDDVEKTVPLDQIKRMLVEIDIESVSYDDWLRIGLSIKSQYQGEDGLEAWDDWSKAGSRYKEKECIQRWKGFSDLGVVRIGTLFYFAKEHGWKPRDEDKRGNKYDTVTEKLNRVFAIVTVGGKIRIIREKTHIHDPIMPHFDLMGKDDFKTLLQNDVIWYEDSKNRSKSISVADIWLAHENRRTYPDGLGLFPDNKTPPGYYNTWKGFSVKPRQGNCNLLLNHMKEVICNGNKDSYNWLLDWCADAVQDPANPKGTAIVMRGEEGAGKGTLANTMGELFGSHYRHLIDDSHLLSNFNAHMIDAILIFADEITWGGNNKTAGKLKGIITEKYLIGERKGVDAVGYRNMNHMLIASNGSWVIPAGSSSRRWFVLDVNDTKTEDRAYFNAIADELKNGGKEAFLYFLLNRKITSDLRRAPVTEALKEQRMRSSANDTVLQWWINCLERGVLDVPDEQIVDVSKNEVNSWPLYVTKPNLYDNYKIWCITDKKNPVSIFVFYIEIKKFKIKSIRPRIGNSKKSVYEIPTIEKSYEILKDKINVPD